jgi:hypothetical protein
MNGQQYYPSKKGNVHFFVLDSNYLDPKQLTWLEKELANAGTTDWKICYFITPCTPRERSMARRQSCARCWCRSF